MTRVCVIGNAGGGKSTLCKKLGKAKGLPVYALDKLQWNRGWIPTEPAEFERRHEELLSRERWIIDGFASWRSIERRFEAADTIIFVDLPLWVHYWWAAKRQFMTIFRPRPDFPEGCPMLPMTSQLMKMIWRIHRRDRPRLLSLTEGYRPEKRVFHIRSPRALRRFVNKHCAQ